MEPTTVTDPAAPAPERARRTVLHAFLEVRGVIGGHTRAHVPVRLESADRTALRATWLPGPHADAPAVVLAHGFGAHSRKPAYARLADGLSSVAHVLAPDLRGHGRSGGLTTLGDREAHDVAAAVAWLRDRGHDRIVLLGVSMGATAVLHAVGAHGVDADAVVVVSATSRFRPEPETAPMQRLSTIWNSAWSRQAMRWVVGIRIVHPQRWSMPRHPVDLAARLQAPLLVVHGQDDAYFPVSDAQELATAAADGTLWLEPAGFGHAEDGLTDAMVARLAGAVVAVAERGVFPTREELA